MWIDIPNAGGDEILFFQGENNKECVQCYNLLLGGVTRLHFGAWESSTGLKRIDSEFISLVSNA